MAEILRDLGNQPNDSIPQAMGGWAETIAAYRCFDNDKATYEPVLSRWEIEIFFRVLKPGCQIEKLPFETQKRFAVCLAFTR